MRRAALTLSLAVGLLSLAGCASGEKPADEPGKKKYISTFKDDLSSNRDTGKELEAEDEARFVAPDGSERQISSWRGKPLVIVFTRGFAGYVCPFCTAYTAQIAERYQEIQALGAEVLLVYPATADDKETKARFEQAVRELLAEEGEEGLPFPVFLDPGLQAVSKFNLQGDLSKPSTFVLDRKGVVTYAYVGAGPDERPSVERIIKELTALNAAQ